MARRSEPLTIIARYAPDEARTLAVLAEVLRQACAVRAGPTLDTRPSQNQSATSGDAADAAQGHGMRRQAGVASDKAPLGDGALPEITDDAGSADAVVVCDYSTPEQTPTSCKAFIVDALLELSGYRLPSCHCLGIRDPAVLARL